jgi:predicted RNA-binding Zn-ribbon protein involved in translation (DUF1610 family)
MVSATIRATCPSCGTVDLPVAGARLLIGLTDEDSRNVVEFSCQRCGLAVRQRVSERATRLLGAGGITVVAATPTAEPADHEGDTV